MVDYYTGLSGAAWIREREGAARPYKLGRDYGVEVEVTLPPRGVTWFVIQGEE